MGLQEERDLVRGAAAEPLRFRGVPTAHYVLGSRSPRRLELLRQIVPADAIEVVPPRCADEADFVGLSAWPEIESRLEEIVRAKCEDVLEQLKARAADPARTVITADTIVLVRDGVVRDGGVRDGVVRDGGGQFRVLGQPPDDPSWADVVRRWFRGHYAGKTHTVATVFCVAEPGRPGVYCAVQSSVTFHDDVDRWLEWYLATGEPRGKAGGYAVQGAGSIFVSRVEGSLSNVVGLPLRELLEILTREQTP
jgi:nucleoside triphosphate pyrophosphatase